MLRKLLFICTALFILLPTSVFASEIKVMVNGEQVQFDQPPVIENDRVYVPIRAVAEKMGWEVVYDDEEKVVDVKKFLYDDLNNIINCIYSINLGSNTAQDFIAINQLIRKDEVKEINIKPIVKNGRTLISVREIGEGMYATVNWDEKSKTVSVDFKLTNLPYFNEVDTIMGPSVVPAEQVPSNEPETEPEHEMAYEEKQKDYEQEIIRLVNEERRKEGLPEVEIYDGLMNVARFKAEEMAELNYFSHNSPTHGSHTDFANSLGVNLKYAGENIQKGMTYPDGAVESWMNSAGHKAHILNPKHKYIGIGYSYCSKTNMAYWSLFMGY